MARRLRLSRPSYVFGSLTLRKIVDRLLTGGLDESIGEPHAVPAGCMLEERAERHVVGFGRHSTGPSQECECLLRCREAVPWG